MNEITKSYSLWDIILYFLKLGSIGFGGPVALVGYMNRDLVQNKKWISEDDYKEGLALAQLAPGPLAAQLAIYLGYVHYKILGATLVGFAFVIPSFVMVLIISIAYQAFGGLPWMQSVFYGVGAAVIGIISQSAYKLTTKSIGKEKVLWAIFLISATITIVTETESILMFIGSGIVFMLYKKTPKMKLNSLSLYPIGTLLATFGLATSDEKNWKMLLFFLKAGAFVFGSGLAIVPFLYSGVVKEYGWLNEQQFLDAVAVAMITPGPVVITVAFIGYIVSGFTGASIAAIATFLPCYLFTILPAPYFKKYGKNPSIKGFVDGVTAAAIGAITGAVIILAKRSLIDIPSILIFLSVVALLVLSKKISEPIIILFAALLGYILKTFVL